MHVQDTDDSRQTQRRTNAAAMMPRSEPPIPRKRGPAPTTIVLSISREDKIRIKTYAATHCTTASDLLHGWIGMFCQD